MQLEFTAVFRKVPEGYVGFVEELPGANTQGATLEEVRRELAVWIRLGHDRLIEETAMMGNHWIRDRVGVTFGIEIHEAPGERTHVIPMTTTDGQRILCYVCAGTVLAASNRKHRAYQ